MTPETTTKLDTLITFLESQSKDAIVTAWDLAIVLKELKAVLVEEKQDE